HSLTTQAGNANWIAISQQDLDQVLTDHPERKVYINLEPCQMEFENVWDFLENLYKQYHDQVAIEITERRETLHSLDYLDDEIHRLRKIGYKLAIDDVCAGSNSYAFIVRQLNVIKRIKLSLLLFRNEDQATRRSFVKAWQTFAIHHHLDFVIEGISDRELAQKFSGNPKILQQSFYWGKGSANI
ncbi:MAG: EAL domain-containing protein, partial [Limosilactobacillus sp.]